MLYIYKSSHKLIEPIEDINKFEDEYLLKLNAIENLRDFKNKLSKKVASCVEDIRWILDPTSKEYLIILLTLNKEVYNLQELNELNHAAYLINSDSNFDLISLMTINQISYDENGNLEEEIDYYYSPLLSSIEVNFELVKCV